MVPIVNSMVDLVRIDTNRSGVLKAFFALVFTNSLVDPERLKEKN